MPVPGSRQCAAKTSAPWRVVSALSNSDKSPSANHTLQNVHARSKPDEPRSAWISQLPTTPGLALTEAWVADHIDSKSLLCSRRSWTSITHEATISPKIESSCKILSSAVVSIRITHASTRRSCQSIRGTWVYRIVGDPPSDFSFRHMLRLDCFEDRP
jgi:hypothetical protein